MTIDNVYELINDNNLGKAKLNERMSNHTSIKTGGKVKLLFIPNSVNAIVEVISACNESNITTKVIGRGSNIIFPDQDLDIVVIKIANTLDQLTIRDNGEIVVEGGYSMQKLAKRLSRLGYAGLEFAGGIPGSVAGAAFMNAGAHSGEMSNVVHEVKFLDDNYQLKSYTNAECQFAYRDSIFHQNNWIILEVVLKMELKDKAEVFKKMSGNLEYRKEMQPLEWPSFGSVFKNPDGNHAGQLIEEAGLKGYKIGGAQVSEKHANFIVNTGDAKSEDIKNLIKHIQSVIYDSKGISLYTEVEMFMDGENV